MLFLVLRTNAGYERWWEARKLWGGIVNQSRSRGSATGRTTRAGGRRSSAGRRRSATRPGTAPRGERRLPALARLLGEEESGHVRTARHMPTAVALRLAAHLREAVDRGALDRVAFLAVDRERAQLIDPVGGCERILKTPLPPIHAIKLRRLIVLYLVWLPPAAEPWWRPGLVTARVAFSAPPAARRHLRDARGQFAGAAGRQKRAARGSIPARWLGSSRVRASPRASTLTAALRRAGVRRA
ncbi:bestrophin family ion channel [Nannocystis exedens]|uniref:bestrophin family ion channel n=1 Tax=Nannocystis exedens TaxID=54 RepID=UPI001B80C4A1|nr:bestrophin family ion channel [Nannocystis exedens]